MTFPFYKFLGFLLHVLVVLHIVYVLAILLVSVLVLCSGSFGFAFLFREKKNYIGLVKTLCNSCNVLTNLITSINYIIDLHSVFKFQLFGINLYKIFLKFCLNHFLSVEFN